jgi:hypothetical protein
MEKNLVFINYQPFEMAEKSLVPSYNVVLFSKSDHCYFSLVAKAGLLEPSLGSNCSRRVFIKSSVCFEMPLDVLTWLRLF